MPTDKQNTALNAFAKIAVPICRQNGYPPRMLLAQWILESGYGTSPSGRNNFFGMKRAKRHGGSWEWVRTLEVLTAQQIKDLGRQKDVKILFTELRTDSRFDVACACQFASYTTPEAGILDKINLIKNGVPYRDAFSAYESDGNEEKLINSIALVYATDPDYAMTVVGISRQSNVREAVADA